MAIDDLKLKVKDVKTYKEMAEYFDGLRKYCLEKSRLNHIENMKNSHPRRK